MCIKYEILNLPIDCGDVRRINAHATLNSTLQTSGRGNSITLRVTRNLSLDFEQRATLSDVTTIASQIGFLLTLLTGTPVEQERCEVYVRSSCGAEEMGQFLWRSPVAASEWYHVNLMPVRFQDLGRAFGEVLSRWFQVCEDYQPIVELLEASIRENRTFVRDRFLSIAQAAEGYCRIRSRDTYIDRSEFDLVRDEIYRLLGKLEHKAFVSKAKADLSRMNDFSFRDRIRRLLQSDFWLRSVLMDQGIEDFAGQVARARNSLTHLESQRSDRQHFVVDEQLIWKLQAVLIISLLTQAGISPVTIFRNVQSFDMAMALWWLGR